MNIELLANRSQEIFCRQVAAELETVDFYCTLTTTKKKIPKAATVERNKGKKKNRHRKHQQQQQYSDRQKIYITVKFCD